MNSEAHTREGYFHNESICKVFRLPANSSSSSSRQTFRMIFKLFQAAPSAPFKEPNQAHSFPAVLLPPPSLPVMPGWFLKQMRMALKRQNEFT